ncbi:Fatty acid desaturase family protein [Myxococcus hansupus]|uniref:Fatty acid desaturase family protein n=1 Tax=Pseudomyxococcus hansupus TaxID=1297742 RepID=A0A0H4XMD7_9BACT|nr:fatty acid desaturase [Myxococcus hansupus]AKQ69462.1 Fatty acid desaturase family protein [Myxococcus hansupus]
MTPVRPSPPSADLPQLAVHALWWCWFPAFILSWDALPTEGRWGMCVLGWAIGFWNYAVLHNHMHLAIVRPRLGNWVVSRTLGMACGFPFRGYYIHHLNHHRFDDGPGDWGRRRPGERVFRYCLRSALTPWLWPYETLGHVWRWAKKKNQRLELAVDFLLVDGLLLAMVVWKPALGLAWWAVLLVTQFCIHWLNLAAHFETNSEKKDSLGTTSYSAFYNRWFFNAGYHQAHHLKPQVPWYELPALTEKLAGTARVRPELTTELSPINPLWVARVAKRYSAKPCDRQTESKITSGTPTAVI